MSILTKFDLYDKVDYEFKTPIRNVRDYNSFYAFTKWDNGEAIRIGSVLKEWVHVNLHVPIRYDKEKKFYHLDIPHISHIPAHVYVYSGTYIDDQINSIVVIADTYQRDAKDIPIIIIESTGIGMYTHLLNVYAHPVSYFQKGVIGYGRFLSQGIMPYLAQYNTDKTSTILHWVHSLR